VLQWAAPGQMLPLVVAPPGTSRQAPGRRIQ
jgi:hypothetical protein